MQKIVFTIVSNQVVADKTYRLELSCSQDIAMTPGQFVNIAIDGKYLRRPISVSDVTRNSLLLYYKTVGEGTKIMSEMAAGQQLELLTELGTGFDADKCKQSALLVGGGLGSAPLYMLCKKLLSQGKKVTVVLGFNTASEVVLADQYRALGVEVYVATMDGTMGVKGFTTDAIKQYDPDYDFFYTCGPLPMMRALCAALPTSGQASLEERMGCGAGYCYGCTIQTAKGPKRVCADGPVFDKEDVIW